MPATLKPFHHKKVSLCCAAENKAAVQHGENVSIKAHNETNPKGTCAEKPCVMGVLAKGKSTIVSDTFVSKLSCLFGPSEVT